MRGFQSKLFFACILLLLLAGCKKKNVYLFSYFVDNGEDGLHLAYSANGLQWYAINEGASVLTPEVGENKLMRDPCITKGPDGTFHMVWTTSWTGKTIGYASSKDLIKWTKQIAIPVMAHEDSVQNCWAPEINYNPEEKNFLIYWSSTIAGKFPETVNSTPNRKRNHRIYYTTTSDFKTFSETRLFYDPGFNVIDASIVRDGSRYVMFIKNETELPVAEKNILVAFSDKMAGPYSIPDKPVTGDYWAEGPTAVKIKGKWHVYFDKYRDHRFGLITSYDMESWTDESEKLKMPEGIRHGTVIEVSPKVLDTLLKTNWAL